MIDVSVPLELVAPETLVGLYQLGKTSSDPDTLLDLILGLKDRKLLGQLKAAMESQGVA